MCGLASKAGHYAAVNRRSLQQSLTVTVYACRLLQGDTITFLSCAVDVLIFKGPTIQIECPDTGIDHNPFAKAACMCINIDTSPFIDV